MSAWRAAMPISTRSPPPPIRIGGRRTGFGSQIASFTEKCWPAKVVVVLGPQALQDLGTYSSSARSALAQRRERQP